MPNSWALEVELEVPSSSWVNARMEPPGSAFVTPAIESRGQLGDPTVAANTTTRSTRESTGYFQKTCRTRRSGGRSLGGVGAAVAAGCCTFSSLSIMLLLLLLARQRLAQPHDP